MARGAGAMEDPAAVGARASSCPWNDHTTTRVQTMTAASCTNIHSHPGHLAAMDCSDGVGESRIIAPPSHRVARPSAPLLRRR